MERQLSADHHADVPGADTCGNTTTCTQTITVNDSIAPQITARRL